MFQVPYPLISLVTRLPQTLQGLSPLAFQCRTFETFSINFGNESDASDVFESVKELTVASKFSPQHRVHLMPDIALAFSICESVICILLCAKPAIY